MKRIISIIILYGLSLTLSALSRQKKIYIAHFPGSNPYEDFYNPDHARDGICKPFCALRQALIAHQYEVHFLYDRVPITPHSIVLSFNNIEPTLLKMIITIDSIHAVLCVFEPPVVCPQLHNTKLSDYFACTLLLSTDTAINHTTRRTFYYPQPELAMIDQDIPFDQKTLCVMMACNKQSSHKQELYSTRKRIASFFNQHHPEAFHLYGTGWHGYQSWHGTVPHKAQVLTQYKFAICFENMGKQRGYITEKIFDCMVAGVVPIYQGAEDITDYVPANCFIDMRQFRTYEDLYRHIAAMTEAEHAGYIEHIRAFLRSERAQLFSINHFVATILTAIESA